MSKKIQLFILMVFVLASKNCFSQDVTSNLLGKWYFESENISGTFYYSNDWNTEELTFNANYTFQYMQWSYENKQLVTHEVDGNWIISKDSSSVILFNSNNRYQNGIQVKTVYKELPLYFLNKNYLCWKDTYRNLSTLKCFTKENVTSSFENDYAKYQHEQLLKNKVTDLNTYYLIAHSDSISKKYKFADYNFVTKNSDYASNFVHQKSNINGKILRITDTSVIIKPHFILTKITTKSNSNIHSAEHFKDGIPRELALKNIQGIHTPGPTIGMKASFWLTVASASTAFVIAPIVGFLSSSDHAKKNFINTAGVGLIGVGVGTGSFFIFHSLEKKFQATGKRSAFLRPKYLSKK
jgi:hypothetical protein